MSLSEEDKKLKDYKKRIRDIEEENEEVTLQLSKARRRIKRLRMERVILLEEIEDLRNGRSKKLNGHQDSDSELSISESVMSDVKAGGHRKGGGAIAATGAAPPPKKKRDPNAPKGPGNVFFLYCRMERDNIKDEVPNESLGEITRLLGQKWKALSKEEKQKYYDAYKKEQDEYEAAMKNYTAAGGGVEGAAAVEAANKLRLEGELKLEEMDDEEEEEEEEEEEIDMLQDDQDDEVKLAPTLSVASPLSVNTDHSMPSQ
ncbi:HMG-box [Backusella circina FSU 941]|nr:HMG-box [Backusella circina FSU 941]